MTERLLSPEDVERIASCRSIAAAKGAASTYAADCVLRAFQGRHLADLCRELGWACGETTVVVIVAGIGTLRMTWTGNRLELIAIPEAPRAVSAITPAPPPLPAPPAMRGERERICADCTHHRADRCTVAGCACAGLGQPAARFSRCPVRKW